MIVLAVIIVLSLTAKYICFATIATSSRMRVTGTLNSLSLSSYSILNEPSSLIHVETVKINRNVERYRHRRQRNREGERKREREREIVIDEEMERERERKRDRGYISFIDLLSD